MARSSPFVRTLRHALTFRHLLCGRGFRNASGAIPGRIPPDPEEGGTGYRGISRPLEERGRIRGGGGRPPPLQEAGKNSGSSPFPPSVPRGRGGAPAHPPPPGRGVRRSGPRGSAGGRGPGVIFAALTVCGGRRGRRPHGRPLRFIAVDRISAFLSPTLFLLHRPSPAPKSEVSRGLREAFLLSRRLPGEGSHVARPTGEQAATAEVGAEPGAPAGRGASRSEGSSGRRRRGGAPAGRSGAAPHRAKVQTGGDGAGRGGARVVARARRPTGRRFKQAATAGRGTGRSVGCGRAGGVVGEGRGRRVRRARVARAAWPAAPETTAPL